MMASISKAEIEAYDRQLAAAEHKAQESAIKAYDAWRAENLNASVAEIREEMKSIVLAETDAYGSAAGEYAARFYDQCCASSNAKLDPAAIPDIGKDTESAIDHRCRWIAGLVADQDEGSGI